MSIVQISSIKLWELAAKAVWSRGKISRLFLHWSAGRYHQCFDDYHINIDDKGKIYLTCSYLDDHKQHTWHRNTGSVGISLNCAYEAVCYEAEAGGIPRIDFGPYPPTQQQIETLAMVIAIITKQLGLDINEETVTTHQEIATLDGYGLYSGDPETRWDLWYLPDRPLTEELRPGGQVLRGKALWYREQLELLKLF